MNPMGKLMTRKIIMIGLRKCSRKYRGLFSCPKISDIIGVCSFLLLEKLKQARSNKSNDVNLSSRIKYRNYFPTTTNRAF